MRAFTLTELLVALTIGSIIMLAVSGAFGLGLRLWRGVEDRRPAEQASARVLTALQCELSGVYLPSLPDGGPRRFQAEGSTKLSFYTASPSYFYGLPAARCARITYEYKDGSLSRSEELAATERLIGSPVTEVVAEGISDFAFAYLQESGEPMPADGGASDGGQPPKLVQVQMAWSMASFSGQFLVVVREPLTADSGE